MNWNLQTFFDAQNDGTEYSDFRNSPQLWNKEKYNERLEKLAKVIKTINADILIFEELEKEGQILDISNKLSGTFDFSKLYKYACFSKKPGTSIGCAVLSRFPVETLTVHSLDYRHNNLTPPSLRPIMKLSLKIKEKDFILFVNHWKSKSGGSSSSDFWRSFQENQLAFLINEALKDCKSVLACGDFNKDILEFEYISSGNNNIRLKGNQNSEVHSPWFNEDGTLINPGSYYFRGNWERIDNYFSSGECEITDFMAENSGEWSEETGKPYRYQLWNGQGYSDHLPITAVIKF